MFDEEWFERQGDHLNRGELAQEHLKIPYMTKMVYRRLLFHRHPHHLTNEASRCLDWIPYSTMDRMVGCLWMLMSINLGQVRLRSWNSSIYRIFDYRSWKSNLQNKL